MSLITKDPIDTLKADQANISKSISRPRRRTAPTFGELADSYQKFEVPRLAHTTAYAVRHNLSRYILPRWSSHVAIELRPLDIEVWFVALQEHGLAPPTISKLRATRDI